MYQHQKKVTVKALREVNLNTEKMKSYRKHQKEANLRNQKKENAQDTISKSVKINYKSLNFLVMKTLKNTVQLIGHVGEDPKSHQFENGKQVSRFSLATNEQFFKDAEKVQETQWHQLVAWGKQAELANNYISKGKEIAVRGKLTYRSYENEVKGKQYITEILVDEILFLGSSKQDKN